MRLQKNELGKNGKRQTVPSLDAVYRLSLVDHQLGAKTPVGGFCEMTHLNLAMTATTGVCDC